MRPTLLGSFKQCLALVGAHVPNRQLHRVQLVLNYMRLGRWMREHNFHFPYRTSDRTGVFDAVARRVRNQRVLYLEFGVFQGASMRYWSCALRHPESSLHGFDSFEGLPEDFCAGGGYRKGRFSTDGMVPHFDDPRVQLFKGWFATTLPAYSVPEHDVLIMTLDADLYSSTIYVLRHFQKWIRSGSFLYFDDLSRPEHELKAFEEFLRDTGRHFIGVAADQSLNAAFFECLG